MMSSMNNLSVGTLLTKTCFKRIHVLNIHLLYEDRDIKIVKSFSNERTKSGYS